MISPTWLALTRPDVTKTRIEARSIPHFFEQNPNPNNASNKINPTAPALTYNGSALTREDFEVDRTFGRSEQRPARLSSLR